MLLVTLFIGLAVPAVWLFLARRRAVRGEGLAATVLVETRTRGPLTLNEIAAAVGKSTWIGRGQVAMALGALMQTNQVRRIPGPPGMPPSRAGDHVRFEYLPPA